MVVIRDRFLTLPRGVHCPQYQRGLGRFYLAEGALIGFIGIYFQRGLPKAFDVAFIPLFIVNGKYLSDRIRATA
jgi:hypothetical protein